MKSKKIKCYIYIRGSTAMQVDGIHEAIIDENVWMETKAKRKVNGVKWNKTYSLEHEHILSGIIKCPICGRGMAGTVRRRKNKKTGDYVDDFYYHCLHRRKMDDEHFCNFRYSLNQDELNREVELLILDIVNLDAFREFVMEKLNTKVDVGSLEAERERIRQLLRQVLGAKNKLTGLYNSLMKLMNKYEIPYEVAETYTIKII